MTDGTLDEALIRLRDTGPERHGWLSNHAPMAVEVLVRRGHPKALVQVAIVAKAPGEI